MCGHTEGDGVGSADVTKHPLYKEGLPPTLEWLRCGRCEHVFARGWFRPDALELLFSGANASQLPGNGNLDQQRQQSARIIERVVAARDGALGRWLDVGFGNGAVVTTAAEFGFHAVGIDVRAEAVERLKLFGFEAHCAPLESFTPAEKFDVVSLCDVLEHVTWPRAALEKAVSLLAPGGCLFVSTPNREAFHWRVLDLAKQNPYWAELEHLHIFGRTQLVKVLEELGLPSCRYSVSERYLVGMELLARR